METTEFDQVYGRSAGGSERISDESGERYSMSSGSGTWLAENSRKNMKSTYRFFSNSKLGKNTSSPAHPPNMTLAEPIPIDEVAVQGNFPHVSSFDIISPIPDCPTQHPPPADIATNNSSSLSKFSMIKLGYAQDDALSALLSANHRKAPRRAPLIHR